MTGLLISVNSPAEAETALRTGVDILDLKNPAEGALGRLPLPIIREIAGIAAGRCTTSATVGDLPMQPQLLADAAAEVAATGVDIVKVGFFGGARMPDCARAIGQRVGDRVKLVAVLMADRQPDFGLIPVLAAAGFYGVMLDTADKRKGSLPDCMQKEDLDAFCAAARANGLVTGLAGALRERHIAVLQRLQPDYLGFRGAVCAGHDRSAGLDALRLQEIKSMLQKCNIRRQEAPIL
ncbi:MAG TPA: (5-formylfuran-3-yl)methyl phosphate synthase [Methylophilaceae bacterium]